MLLPRATPIIQAQQEANLENASNAASRVTGALSVLVLRAASVVLVEGVGENQQEPRPSPNAVEVQDQQEGEGQRGRHQAVNGKKRLSLRLMTGERGLTRLC
ncbi:hypothetical protein FRC02_006967 [Tulasnella sp. 418]|nr:hypothetical protein FRC02_006967 [Tulasnella sp. 418]